MPVQPIEKGSSNQSHKEHASAVTAISSITYKPPPTLAPSHTKPASSTSPSSRFSSGSIHHVNSLTMDNPPSPFQPELSSLSSASPRGGRLNELLNLGRSRAVSADSYAPSHLSQSSDSSGASSSGSTPEEAEVAESGRGGAVSAAGVMRQLLRAGQLRKRSPRGLQLWQSRYCWLYSDGLQYSKTRDSRAMQGCIALAAIKSVQAAKAVKAATVGGSAGDKQRRRFDVVISAAPDDKHDSDGRTFHFEASTEREADEWVIALTQACRKAASATTADSRRGTGESDKVWKNNPSRTSGGLPPQHPSSSVPGRISLSGVPRPSSAESRRRTDGAGVMQQAMSRLGQSSSLLPSSVSASHWSGNSNSPSSMSAASTALGPVSPIQAPTVHGDLPPSLLTRAASGADSPVSAFASYSITSVPSFLPSSGSLTSSRYADDRSSPLPPPAPTIPAMLDVVQRIDFHPIGDWFLCRDKSATEASWFLMHATHQSHPLFAAVHATIATPTFTDGQHPYLLHRLAAFTSVDAVFALYTPAFRPSDTLMSYLQAHRRLPEPVVRYVAVHVVRALVSLHVNSQSYPLLSPASLAFDGAAAVYLTDPIPSLSIHPQLPEYQLRHSEREGSRADWWRLGVLLYELAVGFPPVRASSDEEFDEWTGVARELERFHPMTLPFPPFVPAGLQSLIRQLLMADMDDRLGCGELADDEITQHPYFEGVQWTSHMHDSLAPPPWVRQHVLKQQARRSLTSRNAAAASASTCSSGPSSTTSTPLHVSRPHTSSAFTFSPLSTPPSAERKLFFPSTMQVSNLSPIDAYMQQQKPPRHLLRLNSASSLSSSPSSTVLHRPSALYLILLGGRGFPLPKDDAASTGTSSLQRIKRRTLGEKGLGALKDGVGAQQGLYVAVHCVGEEETEEALSEQRVRTSRLVVGPAACQPSFGDAFLFTLPGDDQRLDNVELSLEIRHTGVGSPLTAEGEPVGQLVGSVSVPFRSLQSAIITSDDIWHSVISSQGLVVGEVHVKYAFTYEQTAETSRRQWWMAAEVQQDGTFESMFGVQLTEAGMDEADPAKTVRDRAGSHHLSVVVEASEDFSRQHSVCLPAGNESQLLLNASTLDSDNTDLQTVTAVPLAPADLFEPQERSALSDVIRGTNATMLSTRPTAADVQILRTVICDSKQRAELNGISVDLSPITSQLIAFSSPVILPALTAYRNPLSHIQLYLQAAYPTIDSLSPNGPSIRIYNLNTDTSSALIPSLGSSALSFAGSAVPAFDALLRWCADVQGWLRGGEGRVVAVHCLSGVWRCCVAVCAYLLFDGQVSTVADAVSLFCRQRLTPAAAATFLLLPSHRRWLEYVERYTAKLRRASFSNPNPPPSLTPAHRTLHLTHVRLAGLSTSTTNPLWGGNDHSLWYIIVHSTAGLLLYDSRVLGSTAAIRERAGSTGGRDVVTSGCEVTGEWRLSVCCEAEVRVSCWLHQFFVGHECYVKLRRDELDWPAGTYRGTRVGSSSAVEDVSVECFFTAA